MSARSLGVGDAGQGVGANAQHAQAMRGRDLVRESDAPMSYNSEGASSGISGGPVSVM